MVNAMFLVTLVFFFALGVYLSYFSWQIEDRLIKDTTGCADSDKFKNSNRGVMFLGTWMIASSVTLMVCSIRCGKNYTVGMWFPILNILLGIVLIVLGAIMANIKKETCGEQLKKNVWTIWVAGLFMFLSSAGHLFLKFRAGQKKSEESVKDSPPVSSQPEQTFPMWVPPEQEEVIPHPPPYPPPPRPPLPSRPSSPPRQQHLSSSQPISKQSRRSIRGRSRRRR
jgi:hypothetical protein